MKKLLNGELHRTYYINTIPRIMKDGIVSHCLQHNITNFSYEKYEEIINEVCQQYYIHVHVNELKIRSFQDANTTIEEAQKSPGKYYNYRTYVCPFNGNINLLSHRPVTVSQEIFNECVFDDNNIYLKISTEIRDTPEHIRKKILNRIESFAVLVPVNINYINQFISNQSESLKNIETYYQLKNIIEFELEIAEQSLSFIKDQH